MLQGQGNLESVLWDSEKERGETRMGLHQLIPPQAWVQAHLWVGGYFPHLHREQVRQKGRGRRGRAKPGTGPCPLPPLRNLVRCDQGCGFHHRGVRRVRAGCRGTPPLTISPDTVSQNWDAGWQGTTSNLLQTTPYHHKRQTFPIFLVLFYKPLFGRKSMPQERIREGICRGWEVRVGRNHS